MVTEEQDQTTKKRQVPKFSPATTMPEDLVENAPEQAKAVLKFCDVKATTVESAAKIQARFNKSQIEELAQYLGLDISPRSDGRKSYKNLNVLAHRCVLKIKSYLVPSICGECLESYTAPHGADAPFTCWICLRGSHDCESSVALRAVLNSLPANLKRAGHIWLCSECIEASHSDKQPTHPPPKTGNENSEEPPSSDATGTIREEPANKTPRPCAFLAKGNCRHGMSGRKEVDGKTCPFLHRKVCKRYRTNGLHSKHGCKRGKDCPNLHPKLCEGSKKRIKDRMCLDKDCPHLHLRGTRRTAPKKSPLQTADQAPEGWNINNMLPTFQMPLSSTPLRPVSQHNPQNAQSGFLTSVLQKIMKSREESLQRADEMEELLGQLAHYQEEQSMANEPQVQYTLPPGMVLTQGVKWQGTTPGQAKNTYRRSIS